MNENKILYEIVNPINDEVEFKIYNIKQNVTELIISTRWGTINDYYRKNKWIGYNENNIDTNEKLELGLFYFGVAFISEKSLLYTINDNELIEILTFLPKQKLITIQNTNNIVNVRYNSELDILTGIRQNDSKMEIGILEGCKLNRGLFLTWHLIVSDLNIVLF